MIDPNQLLQIIQQLHQKNNTDTGASISPLPAQSPYLSSSSQNTNPQRAPSMLGFLGGLGDSNNTQGGVDPSWLTQMNQAIMKQTGQANGNQPFPWQQQPAGQQLGQQANQAGSGIMKFLTSFL